jgi:hypothetical protein
MADLDYGSYTGVASNSELLTRPDKTFSIKGQAGFLVVVLALGVLVIGAESNLAAFYHLVASGSVPGLSFNVSR